MFGEVRWTEESEAHIARHDVTPGEVEEAIYLRPTYEAPGREETTIVFGQTAAGRYLLVVVSEAIDGRDFIVTARDMTNDERDLFRERGQ